jgi:hypothetical protein
MPRGKKKEEVENVDSQLAELEEKATEELQEQIKTDAEELEEIKVEQNKVVSEPPKEQYQKLLNGQKYELWHEDGEYKIYEKRAGINQRGLLLMQIEKEIGKANKLFNALESHALQYARREAIKPQIV